MSCAGILILYSTFGLLWCRKCFTNKVVGLVSNDLFWKNLQICFSGHISDQIQVLSNRFWNQIRFLNFRTALCFRIRF